MTKKGQAGRALGAALMSSLVAGLEGAVILAISIPIMRPLVLFFGAPELFMLTILGITFLATLSSASLSKGILAGGIGLAISSVGIEDHTGTLTVHPRNHLSLGRFESGARGRGTLRYPPRSWTWP